MTNFRKNKALLRIACLFVTISFLSNAALPTYARAQDLILPAPTQFVNLSASYSFPVLKGMRFDSKNPLEMEFIIDTVDQKEVSEEEASRLIKYFLAGLTIPDDELWVNMSPYEKDRMITQALSETDLGKDLLSQDYILKQLSASLTYPESNTGKDFWQKTYEEVLKVAKTTKLPVNTFNKIWIMPERADVYENENTALITNATLKTMLEEDYLALKSNVADIQKKKKNMQEGLIEKVNEVSSNVVRQTIIPKINAEVNSGKNFATLRQIYYSLILAAWFKEKFKESIYKHYIDKGKVAGIDLNEKDAKDKIYNLYVEAFKKGVYNYIKQDYDSGTRRNIKRQYFSGGFVRGPLSEFMYRHNLPGNTLPFNSGLDGGDRTVRVAVDPIRTGTAESPVVSNSPVVTTLEKDDAEAHVRSYATVFGPLAKAIKDAGSNLIIRTVVFGRGKKVGSLGINRTNMSEEVKVNIGKNIAQDAIAAFETVEVDIQNPWIDYSMTTLRTKDRRPINAATLRQVLSADPRIVLLEIPAEVKKGKLGAPGQIDTKKFEERLNDLLVNELRKRGINPNRIPTAPKSFPAFTQVTESSIKGEIKLAMFVPTPKSDIGRLMQLAQDSGINLKELLEKEMPAPKVEGELALLDKAPTLPKFSKEIKVPKEKSVEPSPLADLLLGPAKIDPALQTIFISKDQLSSFDHEDLKKEVLETYIRIIIKRVIETGKLVRIIVPGDTQLSSDINDLLSLFLRALPGEITIGSHPLVRGENNYTAFIIQPKIPYIFVGYGNEAIKLAPAFEVSGFGTPAISVFSLNRPERVVHAFEMGYNVYLTDRFKQNEETGEQVNTYINNKAELEKFEKNLRKLLIDAYIAKERNRLLEGIPESERAAKTAEILKSAKELGTKEAEKRFSQQYKGLLSVGLQRGEFDLVNDATPEGSGTANKKTLYEPALLVNPDLKAVYQGGEKATVAEASFSAVTADFEAVTDVAHLRHVSCNTTGLSSIVTPVVEGIGVPLEVDNLAIRRVVDPGDMKGAVVSAQYISAYHHGPDLLTVTPEEDLAFIESTINTDAAQSGATRTFHMHVLSLRRIDGKPLEKKAVQKILAMQSRVALVDFPGGVFDSTRLSELTHNLLPQWTKWAPEGAHHPLVPILTVQETDDPSELRLIYAVPQESIVAAGNVNAAHALFKLASKDASLAIVNDALGIPQLVQAIESRLPIQTSSSSLDNKASEGLQRTSSAIHKTTIAGNWKLRKEKDFLSEEQVRAKAREFRSGLADIGKEQADIVIFVEDKWTKAIAEEWKGSNISVGVQSFHFDPAGNIEQQIQDAVNNRDEYAMIGHSMHRYPKPEVIPGLAPLANEGANKIVTAILKDGRLKLWYVIAVDEDTTKDFSLQEDFFREQIADAVNIGLEGISAEQLSNILITVEPLHDISTKSGDGKIDPKTEVNPPKVDMLARLLNQALANKFGKASETINTGYGASVKPHTSEILLSQEHIFNVLPGGASLELNNFRPLILNAIKGAQNKAASAITAHQAITNLVETRDMGYLEAVRAVDTAKLVALPEKGKFAPGHDVFEALRNNNQSAIAVNIVSYDQIEGHIRAAMKQNAILIMEVARSQLGYALDENKVMGYVKKTIEKIEKETGKQVPPIVVHGDHIQYTEASFKVFAMLETEFAKSLENVVLKDEHKELFKQSLAKGVEGINDIDQVLLENVQKKLKENATAERKKITEINERLIKAGFTSIAIDASTLYDEYAGDLVLDYYAKYGTAAEKLVVRLEKSFALPLEWGAELLKLDPQASEGKAKFEAIKDEVESNMTKRDWPRDEINRILAELDAAVGVMVNEARSNNLDPQEVIASYDKIMTEIAEATIAGKLSNDILNSLSDKQKLLFLPTSNTEETAYQLKQIKELVATYRPDLVGHFGIEAEVGHVDRKYPNPKKKGKDGKPVMEAKMTQPMAVRVMGNYLKNQGLSFDLIATNNGSGHGTEFDKETLTPKSQVGKISPFLTRELQKEASAFGASIAQHGTSGSDMDELRELSKSGVIKFNIATNYQQIVLNVLSLVDSGFTGEALEKQVTADQDALMSGLHQDSRAKILALAKQIKDNPSEAEVKEDDTLFTQFLKLTYAWGVGKKKVKDTSSDKDIATVMAKEFKRVFGKMDNALVGLDVASSAINSVASSSTITTNAESEIDPSLRDLQLRDDNSEAGAPSYGGIDLGNIGVKAAPGSSPVNMPAIDLSNIQGFTFRILRMEPIINPGSIFGIFPKAENEKTEEQQLAYLKN